MDNEKINAFNDGNAEKIMRSMYRIQLLTEYQIEEAIRSTRATCLAIGILTIAVALLTYLTFHR
jgi:hypothetical protein